MNNDFANRAVALGEDVETHIVEMEVEERPVTIEERITYLEQMVKQHTLSLDSLFQIVKVLRDENVSQDMQKHIDKRIADNKSDSTIPVGTVLKGMTNGTPFWCVVKKDGFWVGVTRYPSLSAAAQGVSGVRRSGWAFWRFDNGEYEGKTVKEVYRG